MNPTLQARILEARQLLQQAPNAFAEWLVAFYREQDAKGWREFLRGFCDLPSSSLADESASPSEPEAITLSALEQALVANRLNLAYQLYTPLVRAGILSQEKVLDLLLSLAARLETSPTQEPQQRLQVCLKLREMAFELDPSRRDNAQVLLMRALQAQDELAVSFYGQALLDSLGGEESLDITQEPLLTELLARLWDDGYLDLFFEVATALQALLLEEQKSGFAAFLAQLANAVDPEQAKRYEGLWTIEDLIGDFFQRAARAFFQNSTSDGYSILGEALLAAAESSQAQESFALRLSLLSESMEKLIHAAQPERVNFVIQEIISLISSRKVDLESLKVNDENLYECLTIAKAILFRVCFCWSYLTDDRSLIRRYQQIGGRIFNDCLSLMASQRDFLWSECWQKNQQNYCGSGRANRKLRVGFLGSCFQRHSVGFLSEATLRNLPRSLVDVIYYYYQGWKSEEMASRDNMYQKFRSHENLHFRFFPEGTKPAQVAAQAREDRIDIMIFMDSITSHDANIVAALRSAPIQTGWLGGDAVGLPEFDYFFADPYILPEDAQADYHERIIRLPSYCAVDHLDVVAANEVDFKTSLRIEPKNVVFLTAASAYKRTPKCIDAHLQILKAVPNGVLIVKGSGEIATVIRHYQERAKELGVLDRVRFLAQASSVEEHRGQLALVDLVLDTFPYTGATHTMEALYMGVPVLTLVGRHYYGRMSYSLLKNVGLEDCITWSVEEFIERGIQLGNNPERLAKAKQTIRDSYHRSIVWDPKRLAKAMERVFFELAYEHQLIQSIPPLEDCQAEPKPAESIRLHIGGKQPHPDWKILDRQVGDHVDYVGSAIDLSQFEDNSIEAIYAPYILQRFNYTRELPTALKEWHRVLRFGGQLMISVPDMPTLCRLYLKDEVSLEQRFRIMRMMFGDQVDEQNYYKVGFSWEYLFALLAQVGFRVIRKVDRFGLFNDCSDMVFLGEPVSLNVVATK
ncbi:FkbM family methyltransferase [Synechococcus sp. 60AY4M2]|uniref:O-linked N-acetylglucosamine transferase family protein n=1 Tax=unclassified Synechococcus TaxID=2626047 RepID=UPI000C621AE5|nr:MULTISPECIES: methyltransferase domain-containing protein [unclassified Synechococcus]PIK94489.1 FkbM family methyltransferase [Synechococcus sp. 60AY4M2]PIK96746.1 FkbM family methyltransferase [Synechococcus sp. 63AY4M1]